MDDLMAKRKGGHCQRESESCFFFPSAFLRVLCTHVRLESIVFVDVLVVHIQGP